MQAICVFGGSEPGTDKKYIQGARLLGKTLAEHHIHLIYGGASVGMMGALADAALEHGTDVIGIIPSALSEKESIHRDLTEVIEVGSMNERKAMMLELSDAFIAMPGGIGTLELFLETITWAQMGMHRKPCGLFNIDSFFGPVLDWVADGVDQGFISERSHRMIIHDADPQALIKKFGEYRAPSVDTWMTNNAI